MKPPFQFFQLNRSGLDGQPALPGAGRTNRWPDFPRRQGGVVLMMALIALVAMTLAALAMVRSVDTTNLVAGNVAAKQAAMQEADAILNQAYMCLDTGGALLSVSLTANSATCNYYATLQTDTVKPYGMPDALESTSGTLNSTTGYTSAYIIERMCDSGTVVWAKATCTESPFGKAALYVDRPSSGLTPPQALYRISVKVSGSRNVAAYAQAIVNGTM